MARRCSTPRCPYPAVAGRQRCRKHGVGGGSKWFGADQGRPNPYDWGHQQRRARHIEAGEQCAMRHLGGCRGQLHLDHIIPLSFGGKAGPENEQILCARHNIKKGGRNRKKSA